MASVKPSITGDFSPSVGVGINVWRRCWDAVWCERLWPAQEAAPTLQAGAALLLASDSSESRRTRGRYQSGRQTSAHCLLGHSFVSVLSTHAMAGNLPEGRHQYSSVQWSILYLCSMNISPRSGEWVMGSSSLTHTWEHVYPASLLP